MEQLIAYLQILQIILFTDFYLQIFKSHWQIIKYSVNVSFELLFLE